MKAPRDCASSDSSNGSEWWAPNFIYPNGWSIASFRKVCHRDHQPFAECYRPQSRSLVTVVLLAFMVQCWRLWGDVL